ncbi:hypothetical protein L7F22_022273 [Adiantum nelumboides]|nr:hypothetical protein [Adiantum nelumboides]
MQKEKRRCGLLFCRNKTNAVSSSGGQVDNKDQGEQTTSTGTDNLMVAVLRVKLHCPACASEVSRSLQGVHGVMEVSVDTKAEVVTVKGCKLEEKRLCDAVHKKTGKRCEVLLLSSMDQLMLQLYQPPPDQPPPAAPANESQNSYNCNALIPAPVLGQSINVANAADQQQQLVSYTSSGPGGAAPPAALAAASSTLRDASEPRIEIRQQTHTVIYGQPTSLHYSPTPTTYANYLDSPYYYATLDTAPLLRYQDWLSEENPNSCKVM